jgi:predicted RND superfamily exporter protein
MLESLSRKIIKIAIPILIVAIALAVLGGYFGSGIEVNMGFKEMVPNDLESMQTMDWIEENLEINLMEASPVVVLVQAESISASMGKINNLTAELKGVENVRETTLMPPMSPPGAKASLIYVYLKRPLDTVESRDKFLSDVDNVLAQDEYQSLNLTAVGLPAVLQQIQERLPWEQWKLVIFTAIGLIVVLALGFRRLSAPVIILCTLGIALMWTLGIMHLFNIPVTVTTMAIFPLCLGLGIDYGIHFLRRYDEERKRGHSVEGCIATSFATTGGAILIASITSIVAFIILATSWFVGLRDLGLSLTFGIALSAIAAFTVLPSLIALGERPER